jgi:drug/metabolite transporter (DMT)-like permease
METKQQVGIGIFLAVTTAVCWGALPIAMKEVLVVMEPFTVVWYRFTIAALGLGIILAVRGRLPPVTMFRQPRWLLILAIATAGLLGNFIFFSSSLQYLSPTASQVIGQLSPVGMMFASVLVLKERMRITQVIGALMLICGLLLFFNVSLIEIFTLLTDYTSGGAVGRVCGDGLGDLWRGAESAVTSISLAANSGNVVHFMCDRAIPSGQA